MHVAGNLKRIKADGTKEFWRNGRLVRREHPDGQVEKPEALPTAGFTLSPSLRAG